MSSAELRKNQVFEGSDRRTRREDFVFCLLSTLSGQSSPDEHGICPIGQDSRRDGVCGVRLGDGKASSISCEYSTQLISRIFCR